jgi:hypothetical protein
MKQTRRNEMTREFLLNVLQDVQEGRLSLAEAHEVIWGAEFEGVTEEISPIGHYETL